MPDPIFDDARLAPLYDPFDPDRSDLDAYVDLVGELGARRVLDLGCGTGTLAVRLAADGVEVVGIDPAAASIDVARAKPGADLVHWVVGTAADAPTGWADLVVMTANVAQVFLTDDAWAATLAETRRALAPGGHLVLETRRPGARAWEGWEKDRLPRTLDVPGTGRVTESFALTEVALPLVSFRLTYRFHDDGAVVTSDSTLRFREATEVRADLAAAGFATTSVREAPDRPGREHVVVAARRPWRVRAAVADDEELLWDALAGAMGWRGDRVDAGALRDDPAVARYVDGWGPDEGGAVAVVDEDPVDGEPVDSDRLVDDPAGDDPAAAGTVLGAAWLRLLPPEAPGYGFVAPDVPELSVAVTGDARGRGVGTALVATVLERARQGGRPGVSLSVERDNDRARRIYERLGFVEVGGDAGAATMLRRF